MTSNGTVQPCSVLKRKRREQSGIGKAEWCPVMEKWSKAENRNGIVEEKRCIATELYGEAGRGNGMAQ